MMKYNNIISGSLPRTKTRRHASVHLIDTVIPTEDNIKQWGQVSIGTASLVGMEKGEMEHKIKNTSSKDRLRDYIRDLFEQY